MLEENGLSWQNTDLVLVGDGSGTGGWVKGCGWSVLVYAQSDRPFFLCGGMNVGSINFAELFAYVHAIAWFDQARDGHAIRKRKELWRVVIFSDNQEVVTVGNSLMTGDRSWTSLPEHRFDWEALRFFVRRGYDFKFFWIPRNTVVENVVADDLSRQCRIAIEQLSSVNGSSVVEDQQGLRKKGKAKQYRQNIRASRGKI